MSSYARSRIARQSIFLAFVQKRKYFIIGILLLVFLYPNFSFLRADDYSSSNFILRDPVITIEGGRSTSTNFEYFSSSGQTITGENTSTNFIHRAGFLYFPSASSPVASVTSSGGGGNFYNSSPPLPSPPFPFNLITPLFQPKFSPKGADLNEDGRVDIVDLSIFLYYSNKPYLARYDFNQDGKIDLVDISILLFYWT